MTTTLPYEPSDLTEASRLLDHLVWSYRRAIDRAPRAFLTAEHICLSDYAARTVGLIRAVMEDDSRRRGVSFHHRPRADTPSRRATQPESRSSDRSGAEPAAPAAAIDAIGIPLNEPDPLIECEASMAEELRGAFEDERGDLTESKMSPRRKVRP